MLARVEIGLGLHVRWPPGFDSARQRLPSAVLGASRGPRAFPRPPTASRVGVGRRLQPILKFESHTGRLRNPEIPDPPLEMFSPEGERRGRTQRSHRRPCDQPARSAVPAAGGRQTATTRLYHLRARPRARKGTLPVPDVLNYLSRVCIFVGEVCAPEFFVWKYCAWLWEKDAFFFLKTKNLSLPFLGCTENTA